MEVAEVDHSVVAVVEDSKELHSAMRNQADIVSMSAVSVTMSVKRKFATHSAKWEP